MQKLCFLHPETHKQFLIGAVVLWWSHTEEVPRLDPTGGNFLAAGKILLSLGKAFDANIANFE